MLPSLFLFLFTPPLPLLMMMSYTQSRGYISYKTISCTERIQEWCCCVMAFSLKTLPHLTALKPSSSGSDGQTDRCTHTCKHTHLCLFESSLKFAWIRTDKCNGAQLDHAYFLLANVTQTNLSLVVQPLLLMSILMLYYTVFAAQCFRWNKRVWSSFWSHGYVTTDNSLPCFVQLLLSACLLAYLFADLTRMSVIRSRGRHCWLDTTNWTSITLLRLCL